MAKRFVFLETAPKPCWGSKWQGQNSRVKLRRSKHPTQKLDMGLELKTDRAEVELRSESLQQVCES